MPAPRALLAAAAATAALAVAAGCGGGGSDAYVKQVTKAAQQFRADAQSASAQFSTSGSAADLRTAAVRYRAAASRFEGRLRSLKPPAGARDEQNQLVTDLRRLSTTLHQVGTKVASADAGNAKALIALASQLEGDVNRVSADGNKLQKAVNSD